MSDINVIFRSSSVYHCHTNKDKRGETNSNDRYDSDHKPYGDNIGNKVDPPKPSFPIHISKVPLDVIVSAFIYQLRSSEVRKSRFWCAQLDLAGLGETVWNIMIRMVFSDVGIAMPLAPICIMRLMKSWYVHLGMDNDGNARDTPLLPHDSWKSIECRKILLTAVAYVCILPRSMLVKNLNSLTILCNKGGLHSEIDWKIKMGTNRKASMMLKVVKDHHTMAVKKTLTCFYQAIIFRDEWNAARLADLLCQWGHTSAGWDTLEMLSSKASSEYGVETAQHFQWCSEYIRHYQALWYFMIGKSNAYSICSSSQKDRTAPFVEHNDGYGYETTTMGSTNKMVLHEWDFVWPDKFKPDDENDSIFFPKHHDQRQRHIYKEDENDHNDGGGKNTMTSSYRHPLYCDSVPKQWKTRHDQNVGIVCSRPIWIQTVLLIIRGANPQAIAGLMNQGDVPRECIVSDENPVHEYHYTHDYRKFEIPDECLNMFTQRGREKQRGIEHYFQTMTKAHIASGRVVDLGDDYAMDAINMYIMEEREHGTAMCNDFSIINRRVSSGVLENGRCDTNGKKEKQKSAPQTTRTRCSIINNTNRISGDEEDDHNQEAGDDSASTPNSSYSSSSSSSCCSSGSSNNSNDGGGGGGGFIYTDDFDVDEKQCKSMEYEETIGIMEEKEAKESERKIMEMNRKAEMEARLRSGLCFANKHFTKVKILNPACFNPIPARKDTTIISDLTILTLKQRKEKNIHLTGIRTNGAHTNGKRSEQVDQQSSTSKNIIMMGPFDIYTVSANAATKYIEMSMIKCIMQRQKQRQRQQEEEEEVNNNNDDYVTSIFMQPFTFCEEKALENSIDKRFFFLLNSMCSHRNWTREDIESTPGRIHDDRDGDGDEEKRTLLFDERLLKSAKYRPMVSIYCKMVDFNVGDMTRIQKSQECLRKGYIIDGDNGGDLYRTTAATVTTTHHHRSLMESIRDIFLYNLLRWIERKPPIVGSNHFINKRIGSRKKIMEILSFCGDSLEPHGIHNPNYYYDYEIDERDKQPDGAPGRVDPNDRWWMREQSSFLLERIRSILKKYDSFYVKFIFLWRKKVLSQLEKMMKDDSSKCVVRGNGKRKRKSRKLAHNSLKDDKNNHLYNRNKKASYSNQKTVQRNCIINSLKVMKESIDTVIKRFHHNDQRPGAGGIGGGGSDSDIGQVSHTSFGEDNIVAFSRWMVYRGFHRLENRLDFWLSREAFVTMS